MTVVNVLSATLLPDGSTRATVELDHHLRIEGVTLSRSVLTGRTTAVPPRHRDGRPMLAWNDHVASDVAAAILASLDGSTVASLGPDRLPFAEPEPPCPACGGDWLRCGCDPDEADAAYSEEPAA